MRKIFRIRRNKLGSLFFIKISRIIIKVGRQFNKQKMQQTTIDSFIRNKRNLPINRDKKKAQDFHESSRQNSQTQMIEHHSQKQQLNHHHKIQVNKVIIIPGPADSIVYVKIHKELEKVRQNYNPNNRSALFQFLQSNLKYQGFDNVDLLRKIEDDTFWRKIVPRMIKLVIQKVDMISSCIRTLVLLDKTVVNVTRLQALILLSSMFLGIMPKNPFTTTRSFGQFMCRRQNDRNNDLKFEKLRFIVNYLSIAIGELEKSEQFGKEELIFQMAISNSYEIKSNLRTSDFDRNIPLLDVQFCDDPDIKIENFFGQAAMVDFANERIGGGVLRRGCVQEQILFLLFPEAIVSMFISPEMQENQSIIMYGLYRYNDYESYSYNLKFKEGYQFRKISNIHKSIMIAIDAIDFGTKYSTNVQFNKEYTMREIVKATTGFSGIEYLADKDIKICTGRWGCGAFKGDEVWKFFIQWIAASEAGRELVYLSDQTEVVTQIRSAVKRILSKSKSTLDVLGLMEGFTEVKLKIKLPVPSNYTFIDYLKDHI